MSARRMKKKRSRGRGHARRKGRSLGVDKWEAKAMKHEPTFPPQLLQLFAPRPPLPPPASPPPLPKHPLPYTGLAQFVSSFADPDDPEYVPSPSQPPETPSQRRARIHALCLEQGAQKAALNLEIYDPHHDPSVSGDPYKTLFVSNINFDTTDSKLEREFERYGPIKRVRVIHDTETGKPKGYAFIEYLHTRDMKAAHKRADGKKIDGRRVIVDVERGRTVSNWRPRRLGGGLGSTRLGSHVNKESVASGHICLNRGHNEEGHMETDRGDDHPATHIKERKRADGMQRFSDEHHGRRAHADDHNEYDRISSSRRSYDRANGNRRTYECDRNGYDHDRRRSDHEDERTHKPDGKRVNNDINCCSNSPQFVRQPNSHSYCYKYHDDNMETERISRRQDDDINRVRFKQMQL